VLEAAYLSNPKPDKAARLDIVRRVSLNEKEVQVSIASAELPRSFHAPRRVPFSTRTNRR